MGLSMKKLLVFFVAAGFHHAAAAQDWIGPSPMDLAWQHSNQIGLMVQQQVLYNQQFPEAGENKQAQTKQSKNAPTRNSMQPNAAGTAKLSAATLTYRPSIAVRKKNLAQFVEKSRAIDPAGADQMAQLFAQQDVIASMAPELAKYGLRIDNVADAYTLWWLNAWLGWAGRTDDASQKQINAVKAQVGRALITVPLYAQATDAQKQEMAESFLIQGAMLGAVIEQLKTNPAMKPQLKTAMAAAGKTMGLDFARLTLSDQGFVPAAAR